MNAKWQLFIKIPIPLEIGNSINLFKPSKNVVRSYKWTSRQEQSRAECLSCSDCCNLNTTIRPSDQLLHCIGIVVQEKYYKLAYSEWCSWNVSLLTFSQSHNLTMSNKSNFQSDLSDAVCQPGLASSYLNTIFTSDSADIEITYISSRKTLLWKMQMYKIVL